VAAVCACGVLPLGAQSHHFVYLSSASAQAIAGFEINQSSGAVTAAADSPFSVGHDPGALAFHPTGRFLYAANPGDNSVSGFSVHPVTGALTELAASPFAAGGGATPKFIAVEPSGKMLYVVTTTNDVQGTAASVSYYSVDISGALDPTPEETISLGLFSPVALLLQPGDRRLYAVGTAGSGSVSIFALGPGCADRSDDRRTLLDRAGAICPVGGTGARRAISFRRARANAGNDRYVCAAGGRCVRASAAQHVFDRGYIWIASCSGHQM